jgi:hypothetical protein
MTESKAIAIPKEPITTGGAIGGLVPQNIEQAFRLAEALSKAGDMIPKGFQGKPMEIMAAIMRGMEVGLAPMQALSSIAVINGRASLWGDALTAIIQRAGHHVDVEIMGEGDAAVAVARLTRGDTGAVIERRFSMADAKRAGLAGKAGPWSSYPMRMLAMRARAFAVRDGAADALMGLSIAEEVSDYAPMRDVTPPMPSLQDRLKQAAAPKVEVVFDPDLATPMDPEYDEGARAFRGGVPSEQNPYPDNPQFSAWHAGWTDAKGAQE